MVQRILGEVEDKQLGQLKVRRRGVTIRDIRQEECRKAGVNLGELRHGGRRRLVTDVRAVVAHRCAGEMAGWF